ncbi:unnamed protein product, partial [Linum tenue]
HFKLILCIVVLGFAVSGGKNNSGIGAEAGNVNEYLICDTVADCGSPGCCRCIGYCVCACPKQVPDAERLAGGSKGLEEDQGKGN